LKSSTQSRPNRRRCTNPATVYDSRLLRPMFYREDIASSRSLALAGPRARALRRAAVLGGRVNGQWGCVPVDRERATAPFFFFSSNPAIARSQRRSTGPDQPTTPRISRDGNHGDVGQDPRHLKVLRFLTSGAVDGRTVSTARWWPAGRAKPWRRIEEKSKSRFTHRPAPFDRESVRRQ